MRAQSSSPPACKALFVASALATVIAVGALVLSAWREYNEAIDGATHLSQQMARLLEEHTQRYVSAPEQALRRLDDHFAGRPLRDLGTEEVRRVAERIKSELPQVASLMIANDKGDVVMMSGNSTLPPTNIADRAYFHAHLIEGRQDLVIGPLILSRELQPRYIFTASLPLIRDGRMAGIIVAALDVKFFLAFYDSLELGPGAVSSVFNDQAWLVARQAPDTIPLDHDYSNLALFREFLPQAPIGTYIRPAGTDGIVRIFSYRRVAGRPLVVNVGLPLQPVIDVWWNHQIPDAVMVLVLLALVQAALWRTWLGLRRERTLSAGLRRALDDNVTLFNEIHHRVKNNMQIVSSMLMIEQVRAGDGALSERLQLVADRVSSMALVHTMLYERHEASQVDVSAYLHELCGNLAEGHGAAERGITLKVSADGSHLAMEQAVPLGLLVNEAVSNALKHAFPDGRPGTIQVDFIGGKESGFSLAVVDNGIGLPARPKGNGVGTTIMRSLASQLDATSTLANRTDGPGTILQVWRRMHQPLWQEDMAVCA